MNIRDGDLWTTNVHHIALHPAKLSSVQAHDSNLTYKLYSMGFIFRQHFPIWRIEIIQESNGNKRYG